jgi:restriction endonuclease S subunit
MVPEGWSRVGIEALFKRLRVTQVYDKKMASDTGSVRILDQSANGHIGYHNNDPDFRADIDHPLVTFANHTCAVRLMKVSFSVIQNVFTLEANPDVDRWFLFYTLDGAVQQQGYRGHWPEVKRLQFLKPPLPEQKKIATILGSVDKAIQATQAVIDQTRKVKQGLLQQLLTRGIGHTRFKQTEIGEIPEEWEVVQVGDIADVIDPQPDHRTPPQVEIGIPYVGMGDIKKDGSIDFCKARVVSPAVLEKQIKSFAIHQGAFVFGKIGTIGNPAILPESRHFALSANVVLITSDNLSIAEFLLPIMQSPLIDSQVHQQINTTSQPALGIKKVRKFYIPMPSTQELQMITRFFCLLDDSIAEQSKNLDHLISCKSGLMQDLLTGRVRVGTLNTAQKAI